MGLAKQFWLGSMSMWVGTFGGTLNPFWGDKDAVLKYSKYKGNLKNFSRYSSSSC